VHFLWRIHGLVVERLTLVLVQAHCLLSLVARLVLCSAPELFPPIPFLFTEHKQCWDSIWCQLTSVADTDKHKKGLVLIFYHNVQSVLISSLHTVYSIITWWGTRVTLTCFPVSCFLSYPYLTESDQRHNGVLYLLPVCTVATAITALCQ